MLLFLCFFLFFIPSADAFRDLSLEEPVERSGPGRIWLINYSDDRGPTKVFSKNANFQLYSAINRGVHGFIQYGPEDLDPQFQEKHKEILKRNKGAGLWIWKPYVLLKTLQNIPENDIVLYLDSGAALQKDASFLKETLKEKDMMFHQGLIKNVTLGNFVTRDALAAAGLGKECLGFPNIWAGLVAAKNCESTRNFVKKWLDHCENHTILTGGSLKNQGKDFRFHHCDQAALMLCLYKETQKPDNQKLNYVLGDRHCFAKTKPGNYYLWHHRHPRGAHTSLSTQHPHL